MEWNNLFESVIRFASGHQDVIKGLAFGSLGFFVLTPIIAPLTILWMPRNALVNSRRHFREISVSRKIGRVLLFFLKNLIGISLTLLGVLLLFMPGQGMLTIFIGLLFTDLPGKRNLLAKVLGMGKIKPLVNRLRERYHRPPLLWPEPPPAPNTAGDADSL
jgi:hypothetical protein